MSKPHTNPNDPKLTGKEARHLSRVFQYEREDRRIVRSFATRSVLEKTDRLLGWNGRVRVIAPHEDQGTSNPPAWTNGEVITLNGCNTKMFSAFQHGLDSKTTLMLTGINYHELAHCFFTPRLDATICERARNAGQWMAFNILEDQAAEMKFVRRYTPAAHYFTATVSQVIAEMKEYIHLNYPLVAGRRYLPADIRRLFRANYAIPEDISRIDQIVDEYIDLVYPDDEERMLHLVFRLHTLLEKLDNRSGGSPTLTSHHGGGFDTSDGAENNPMNGMSRGEPLTPEQQREIVSQIRKGQIGVDISDEEIGGPSHEESGEDGEATDGEEEGDEGVEEGTAQIIDLPGGRGAGDDPYGEYTKWEPGLLDDLVDEAISGATEAMSDELNARKTAIRESLDAYRVSAERSQYLDLPVEPQHAHAAREVERELRRIRQRHKPAWTSRQETGKVDTNQLASIRRGKNDVFKRWNEGVHNATDMEVVILLDQSGSMYHHSEEAGTALWVLYRALRNVGAQVTVLGYADGKQCSVLIQRGEETPKQRRNYFAGGPTYVMPALNEARRIFSSSNKPLKILEIVTDGVLSDTDEAKPALRSMDHPVAIVGINEDVSQRWKPHEIPALKEAQTISTPMDLVMFTRRFVSRMIRERYTK